MSSGEPIAGDLHDGFWLGSGTSGLYRKAWLYHPKPTDLTQKSHWQIPTKTKNRFPEMKMIVFGCWGVLTKCVSLCQYDQTSGYLQFREVFVTNCKSFETIGDTFFMKSQYGHSLVYPSSSGSSRPVLRIDRLRRPYKLISGLVPPPHSVLGLHILKGWQNLVELSTRSSFLT